MAYSDVILAESALVNYWKLDETSGTSAADSKGTYTGTYSGTYTQAVAPAPGGTAVTFGGGNVSASPGATLDAPFTVEAWFQSTSSSSPLSIVGSRSGGNYYDLSLSNATGTFRLHGDIGNGSSWINNNVDSNPVVFNDGRWHHVAVAILAGSFKVYYDGLLQGSGSLSGTGRLWSATTTFKIGDNGTSEPFSGAIDEVAVYNAELTADRVLAHFREGIGSIGGNPAPVPAVLKPSRPKLRDGRNVIFCLPLVDRGGQTLRYLGRMKQGFGVVAAGADSQYSSGLAGPALTLDGSTQRADLDAFDLVKAVSIEVVVALLGYGTPDTNGDAEFVGNMVSNGTSGLWLGWNSRSHRATFEVSGAGKIAGTRLVPGTLYHLVGTYDGKNQVLYTNGSLDVTSAQTAYNSGGDQWSVGGRHNGNRWSNIRVEFVAVYDYALSQEDVARHFADPYVPIRVKPPTSIFLSASAAIFTKAASASVILTPTAAESALFARSATASVVLTAAASTASTFSKAAAASVVLTPTTSESAAFTRAATASIVVTASPSTASAFTRSAIASVVLTPTAAESLARPVNATASVVLTASASESLEHPVAAAASVILTASASTTATMSHAVTAAVSVVLTASALESAAFIKTAPVSIVLTATAVVGLAPMVGGLAVVFLTASASAAMSHAVTASASVVLRAAALANGGGRTARVSSAARVVLRARARLRRPWISFSGQYLGRYQQGVKVFRWPPSQEVTIRNVLPEEDPARRKGILYLYGEAGEVTHAELSVYEVVPGGDPGGPVIATHALARPDGDQVLAQLGSGVLAAGQGPYLDEGI